MYDASIMRRIALRTLFQSKGKALSAVVGVAAAGTLILVQLGLYLGFLLTSSALVMRSGGDVWVMASGTEVLDNAEALGPTARQRLASHPCVQRVRGVIVDYMQVRAPSGELVATQVFGIERPGGSSPLMPWSMRHGLPSALDAPGRVAVEALDARKLHIEGEPLGTALEASGDRVHVAAMSHGLRSFTLMPYIFTRLALARRISRYGDGQATFWIADLSQPSCAAAVIAHVEADRELDAHTAGDFVAITQGFWVHNSGVGTVLTFGAVLALVVGMIVIGQTLSAITRSHLRELGTLKALGASRRELAGFVVWQAAFLMVLGGCLAVALAHGCRALLGRFGLEVALSSGVLALGGLAVFTMCALASSRSVRVVLKLEANEVMK
jgi:putative ABC transport system permease protein